MASGGQLTITFASRGGIGAVFHVTSAGDPRSYTVGAGRSLAGSWPLAAGQDVRVHGPNGFYRQFTGTGPDVAAGPAGDGLRLKITNPSSAAARLTVADAYAGKSVKVTVRGRAASVVLIGTERGSGWYDVSVTAAGDPSYLRRLAGHVETGRPSISDPAFGNP
jgi:phospholipase C